MTQLNFQMKECNLSMEVLYILSSKKLIPLLVCPKYIYVKYSVMMAEKDSFVSQLRVNLNYHKQCTHRLRHGLQRELLLLKF